MDTQNTTEMQNISVSELGDNCAAFYHRGHKAEDVAEYNYKIRDGSDTEDRIEVRSWGALIT